jgi:hypothetical protein
MRCSCDCLGRVGRGWAEVAWRRFQALAAALRQWDRPKRYVSGTLARDRQQDLPSGGRRDMSGRHRPCSGAQAGPAVRSPRGAAASLGLGQARVDEVFGAAPEWAVGFCG